MKWEKALTASNLVYEIDMAKMLLDEYDNAYERFVESTDISESLAVLHEVVTDIVRAHIKGLYNKIEAL